jgi:hypothetical protein
MNNAVDIMCRPIVDKGEDLNRNEEPNLQALSHEAIEDHSAWTRSPEAKKEFLKVDRGSEDEMVNEYKKHENPDLLEKLYELREPTLKVWARKHAYLAPSEEDMFADLRTVWLKCVMSYKYDPDIRAVRTKSGAFVHDEDGRVKTSFKRTPFNTFMYTALRNYVSNLIKKKYAKKRLDADGVPLDFTMKSLDYEYGDNDGDGQSLYNILAGETHKEGSEMDAAKIINDISGGDPDIKQALESFAFDSHLKKLSTACRLCKGTVPISREEKRTLVGGGTKGTRLLNKLIRFSGRFSKDFKVLSYQVFRRRVDYEVYGQDTKLLRKVQKAMEAYKEKVTCSVEG